MSIPVSKDLRGLMEVAREQDWTVLRPEDNQLRWIPPKGEIVETTVTESILSIKAALVMGGLKLDSTHPKVKFDSSTATPSPLPPPEPPAPAPVPTPTPPQEPKVEEQIAVPKKRTPRGQNTALVMEYITDHKDSVIVTQRVMEDTGLAQSAVGRAMQQMEDLGTIVRISKGKYQWNDGKEKNSGPAPTKTAVSKTQAGITDLDEAMGKVVDAVANLESVVTTIADKLKVLEQLQALLKK